MRETILLYTNYDERLSKLSDEQYGKLMRAVMQYQRTGEVPVIEDITVSVSFDFIKADLDRNNAKFEEICEKRREAGKKGGLAKASNAKQKLANGSKAKQSLANSTLYENENEYENNNNIVNKSNSLHSLDCINSSDESDKSEDEKYAELVNDLKQQAEENKVKEVVHEYEHLCEDLPQISKLTAERKKKVKARLKTYSLEEISRCFKLADESDFLSGRSGTWKASFDWFFANDKNIQKVLEGNYSNKSPTKKNSFNNFDQRSYDMAALEKKLINRSG